MSPAVRQVAARVFFCHGSRDPGWRAPFDALVADQRACAPDLRVAIAFLELMTPSLPDVLDVLAREGCDRIEVVPLFLAPGKHTRVDLPALVMAARTRWPRLAIDVVPTLLETVGIRSAILATLGPSRASS